MTDLWTRLAEHARHRGDATALLDKDRRLGYRELPGRIETLAEALARSGTRRLALDNGIDWALLDLACARAGLVAVPVPGFFSDQQRQWLLDSSGADTLIGPPAEGWQPWSPAPGPASHPPLPLPTTSEGCTSHSVSFHVTMHMRLKCSYIFC
ncbi:hypothetical protein CGX12_17215 [Zobellella denitrificans]|uniref:AMP-binding protein n=1 Tax=Zobellella denitrificans TaxID=347534 RepID=UPI000B8C6214|nr:AMP-binding protein [Zobellella denitrificans]OXS13901.1 hypothetical protein CGX12_17215 [Zobellella denitrificans]